LQIAQGAGWAIASCSSVGPYLYSVFRVPELFRTLFGAPFIVRDPAKLRFSVDFGPFLCDLFGPLWVLPLLSRLCSIYGHFMILAAHEFVGSYRSWVLSGLSLPVLKVSYGFTWVQVIVLPLPGIDVFGTRSR
jgi:hypothetical protein